MPLSTSAKKALRRDARRTEVNNKVRAKLRNTIKDIKKTNNKEDLPKLYEAADMAAKKKIIHPNKAARIKSRITKSLNQADSPKETAPAKPKTKKATKKSPAKKTTAKKTATKKSTTKKTSAKKTSTKSSK